MKTAAQLAGARCAPQGALRRQLILLLAAGLAVVALLLAPSAGSARFVWNVTPSAPAGLYLVEPGAWKVGDRVAVLPPKTLANDLAKRGVLPQGKLLIKRVAAGAGDVVCRGDRTLTINGIAVAIARTSDSFGRALPAWAGCVTLTTEAVFLLGDTPSSYDARYFGASPSSAILGRVVPLLKF